MNIDITESKDIKGWMSDYELTWLAEQATTHKVIVEVGCYLGRSTRTLANHTSGKVYVIENFLGVPEEGPLSPEDSRKLFLEFKENLQDHIDSKKVVIIHPDDLKTVRGQAIIPDFVFIDGDHSYEAVSRDIKFWGSRLAQGGLLSGHDCNYGPVKQALQDLVPDVKYGQSTSIWYTYKE